MLKQVADIVDVLTYIELSEILTALGYSIREQITFSHALSELGFTITQIHDSDGFWSDEYQDIENDIDLALLAGLIASKLAAIATTREAAFIR